MRTETRRFIRRIRVDGFSHKRHIDKKTTSEGNAWKTGRGSNEADNLWIFVLL